MDPRSDVVHHLFPNFISIHSIFCQYQAAQIGEESILSFKKNETSNFSLSSYPQTSFLCFYWIEKNPTTTICLGIINEISTVLEK